MNFKNAINEVLEIRTDAGKSDRIRKRFSILTKLENGQELELVFTLAGGKMVRDSFDAIPEIDKA